MKKGKIQTLLASLALLLLLALPVRVFALSVTMPKVTGLPAYVTDSTYTFTILVDARSKVYVLGGPFDIAPVVDGEGTDKMDGVVHVTVGLAPGVDNVFSITASRNGSSSDALEVTLHQGAPAAGTPAPAPDNGTAPADSGSPAATSNARADSSAKGDVTAPETPVIDPVPALIHTRSYTLTGSTEADANITVVDPSRTVIAGGKANSNGLFSIKVSFQPGTNNPVLINAEDAAYNVSPYTEVVITVAADAPAEKPDTSLTHNPFKDVTTHWGRTYIQQLYDDGIVAGKTSESFDPNGQITRAELTKIALKAFKHTVDEHIQVSNFSDVPKDAWFAPYVEKARQLGIITGFSDGTFHPNEPITRAAAVKILVEASGQDYASPNMDFKDVPPDAWYTSFLSYAARKGVLSGYTDGTLRPENPITRAEVSKIVVKLMSIK